MAETRVQTPEDLTARTSPRPLTPLEAVARPTDPYYRSTANPVAEPGDGGEFRDFVRQLNIAGPQLQDSLQTLSNKQNEQDLKAGVEARLKNQKSFKDAVAQGLIPEAGNPWFVKGYQQQDGRLSAMEYDAKLRTEWANGPVKNGSLDDFEKFKADSRKAWMQDHQGASQDWMDGFIPGLHQSESSLTAQHISYQQQQMSAAVRENTANEINGLLDQQHERELQMSPADPLVQEGRNQTAEVIQARLKDMVAKGLPGTDANKILAETVMAKGVELRDDTYARGILTHIQTPGGSVAKIADVAKALNANETHIIALNDAAKKEAWAEEDRPFHVMTRDFGVQQIEHSKKEWAIQQKNEDKKDATEGYLKEGVSNILAGRGLDPVKLQELSQINPQAVEWLRNFKDSELTRSERIVTDKTAAATMMARIFTDPESVSIKQIFGGVQSKTWDMPVAMEMANHQVEMSKLHKDPAMQDPIFKVQLGSMKSAIAGDATGLFGQPALNAGAAEIEMMQYWKGIQNDPDKYGKMRLKAMELAQHYNSSLTEAKAYKETPGAPQPPVKIRVPAGATPYDRAKAAIPPEAIKFLVDNPQHVREFESKFGLPAGMGDQFLDRETPKKGTRALNNRTFD